MDREAFREAMRDKSLTAAERKRIATKASKAAARARTAQARAKAKKQKTSAGGSQDFDRAKAVWQAKGIED